MQQLKNALEKSFSDFRLSKNEKYALRELFNDFVEQPDALSYARNTAFDLANIHLQAQPQFDVQAYKWLEQVVKTIDSVRNEQGAAVKNEAFFSPGDACKGRIVSLINNARGKADICVFTISDNEIAEAILNAHNRGVKVRVISDNDKANDRGSDIDYLQEQGVKLAKDRSSNHMHHKFAIIDNRYLINGSFNWTRSASHYNEENITILGDPALLEAFSAEFESLWSKFYTPYGA